MSSYVAKPGQLTALDGGEERFLGAHIGTDQTPDVGALGRKCGAVFSGISFQMPVLDISHLEIRKPNERRKIYGL